MYKVKNDTVTGSLAGTNLESLNLVRLIKLLEAKANAIQKRASFKYRKAPNLPPPKCIIVSQVCVKQMF